MVPVILEQLVTRKESVRAYRNLVFRYGTPAPGPVPLRLAPSPDVLRALPDHVFVPLGLLGRHARTLRAVASRAERFEEADRFDPATAARRFMAMPGIGPWTAQYTLGKALGHADAVPIGDFHLPRLVSHALAGEDEGDDARMLELLEPFRPHRFRVIRLLMAAGLGPARRSPLPAIRPLPRE
jgi:3-methyladenine DNA glycosylase/8-oxoguanine DNA glycosylase